MTNFDFLKQEPKFNSFSDVAIAAEKVLKIDKESSVINCRRAMEFAIKWMYSVDKSLGMPYQDKLVSLMSTEDFHDLVDDALWKRLDLIRKIGNRAAHNGRKITEDEAILCLQNLFVPSQLCRNRILRRLLCPTRSFRSRPCQLQSRSSRAS